MKTTIRIEKLNISFGYNVLIKDLNLTINQNTILSIFGKNGMGKTTLIKCFTKQFDNYAGNIYIGDRNVQEFSIEELSKIIAVVYSGGELFQDLKVMDYLVMGCTNKMTLFENPSNEFYSFAYDMLKSIEKAYLYNKNIFSLSSGEMQIVKIVRGILQKTQILILDEPTENLDIENQIQVLNLIEDLKNRGYTIIMITHNPRHMLELGGQILMLTGGENLICNSNELFNKNILNKLSTANVEWIKNNNDFVMKFYKRDKKLYF